MPHVSPPGRRGLAGALALGLVLFLVAQVPGLVAARGAPQGQAYVGFLAYPADQNMYASFVNQAAEGRLLLANRLAHDAREGALLQPEWLVVGWVQALAGRDWAWTLWRLAGALALALGFRALARRVLPEPRARGIATALALAGGGLGWVVLVLERLGWIAPAPGLQVDLYLGLWPFVQVLYNPHFSLPLGLFLGFAAAFLEGERTGSTRAYGVAAALLVLEGLARPYDLFTVACALPLHLLATRLLGLAAPPLRRRLLPLAALAPVLAYEAWLFRFHPDFSRWGGRGQQPPSVPGLLLALGLPGVLALVRVVRLRRSPPSSAEAWLLAWALVVLAIVNLEHVGPDLLPFGEQLLTTLAPPLVLLGVPVLLAWRSTGAALAAFVTVSCAGSVAALLFNVARVPDDPTLFVSRAELRALAWLDEHAEPDDVVLATYRTGNLLAGRTHLRPVLGHWSATPDMGRLVRGTRRFYEGELEPERAVTWLGELGCRYVLVGPAERRLGGAVEDLPGLERVHEGGGYEILEVRPAEREP